jgi:hypothetical protein
MVVNFASVIDLRILFFTMFLIILGLLLIFKNFIMELSLINFFTALKAGLLVLCMTL